MSAEWNMWLSAAAHQIACMVTHESMKVGDQWPKALSQVLRAEAGQPGSMGALGASSSKAHLGTPEVLVGLRVVFSIPAFAFSPSQWEQVVSQGHAGLQGLVGVQ